MKPFPQLENAEHHTQTVGANPWTAHSDICQLQRVINMRHVHNISLSAWLAIATATTVSAQSSLLPDAEIEQELEKTRTAIRESENSVDRLDRSMLEPLNQLGSQLMDAGEYDEAHSVLDHEAQIIRASEGLFSPTQIPVLLRRIENYGYQRDWDNARESIGHLDWLLTSNEYEIDETFLESLLSLVDIHLWGVADDRPDLQDFHFRRAKRLNDLAIRAAIHVWGENNKRLPALRYKLVIQIYLQTASVEVGGSTGIALRRYSESGLTLSRKDARLSFYYTGLGLLGRSLDLYANQPSPDLEGMALTSMYIGDWNVLFGNSEAAAQAYARSHELLLESGIELQQINQYFAQPKLLPDLEFADNWVAAMATLNDKPETALAGVDSVALNFQQWSVKFPYHLAPVALGTEPITVPEEDYAMFSFSLDGLEEVAHYYKGRRKTAVSSPRNLELLSQNFNKQINRLDLEDTIMSFHFRPKLVDGIPQPVNSTLIYQLAPQ